MEMIIINYYEDWAWTTTAVWVVSYNQNGFDCITSYQGNSRV